MAVHGCLWLPGVADGADGVHTHRLVEHIPPSVPTVSSTATSSCSWSISRALQVTRVPCAQLPGQRTVVRGYGKCLQHCGTGLHEVRLSALDT